MEGAWGGRAMQREGGLKGARMESAEGGLTSAARIFKIRKEVHVRRRRHI
jgi:hypothetical protein